MGITDISTAIPVPALGHAPTQALLKEPQALTLTVADPPQLRESSIHDAASEKAATHTIDYRVCWPLRPSLRSMNVGACRESGWPWDMTVKEPWRTAARGSQEGRPALPWSCVSAELGTLAPECSQDWHQLPPLECDHLVPQGLCLVQCSAATNFKFIVISEQESLGFHFDLGL